ncbi:hypothetical protein IMY05_C4378001500 [Salix suchowensis]|nr:hypothetical protein IMY05_C4378001500 [Salix suchowensis]
MYLRSSDLAGLITDDDEEPSSLEVLNLNNTRWTIRRNIHFNMPISSRFRGSRNKVHKFDELPGVRVRDRRRFFEVSSRRAPVDTIARYSTSSPTGRSGKRKEKTVHHNDMCIVILYSVTLSLVIRTFIPNGASEARWAAVDPVQPLPMDRKSQTVTQRRIMTAYLRIDHIGCRPGAACGCAGRDVVVEERVEETGVLELGKELTLVAVEVTVALLGVVSLQYLHKKFRDRSSQCRHYNRHVLVVDPEAGNSTHRPYVLGSPEMIAEAAEPNPWTASLILTQFTPASLDRKIPMPPMSAAAKRAGYPPDVAGAPRAMAQACVTPLMVEKDAPLFVEWKRPLSVETHTSPKTALVFLSEAMVAPAGRELTWVKVAWLFEIWIPFEVVRQRIAVPSAEMATLLPLTLSAAP